MKKKAKKCANKKKPTLKITLTEKVRDLKNECYEVVNLINKLNLQSIKN